MATGTKAVAWTAVGLLMVTISLGLCTVTLWTPYTAGRPGERRAPVPTDESPVVMPDNLVGAADSPDSLITDEMIAQFLAEPQGTRQHRPIRPNPEVLVPIAHGFAAISRFVLAVMAAIM